MGKTKPERNHESVVKAIQNMGRKTSLYYFFVDAFFLEKFPKQSATVQNSMWGRQNHKEAHESVVKATQNMGIYTSLYYYFF